MAVFEDNKGRRWAIDITVVEMKRIRKLCGVDLYEIGDKGFKPLQALIDNPPLFVDVLYALCQTEAEKRGVADEDFGRALVGDALEAAGDAFIEALTDFFPSRQRKGLTKLVAKGKAISERLIAETERKLEAIDPEKEAGKIIAKMKREAVMRHQEERDEIPTEVLEVAAEIARETARMKIAESAGNDSSTASPESAESTPTPSLSAS